MNLAQVNAFFAKISKDDLLHLDKPQTGCFFRAGIICEALKALGEKPKIVRTKPTHQMLKGNIATKGDGDERAALHEANWRFHVAAAVEVNGEILVLDPAMLNAPETIAGWAKNIKAGEQRLSEKDVAVFDWGTAKNILEDDKKQSGFSDSEKFFAAQPDRFAGQKIVRFPSQWARHQQQMMMTRQR